MTSIFIVNHITERMVVEEVSAFTWKELITCSSLIIIEKSKNLNLTPNIDDSNDYCCACERTVYFKDELSVPIGSGTSNAIAKSIQKRTMIHSHLIPDKNNSIITAVHANKSNLVKTILIIIRKIYII
jgi:hypothetical protein